VDDIQGPIDVQGHAQDANMVAYNNVIESVVYIVSIGVLEDIHIPVRK
jgi:hypothetical protein